MLPGMILAGGPAVVDREPWGKAFSISVTAHGVLAFLFLSLAVTKPALLPTILTEVNVIETLDEDRPLPGKYGGASEQRRGDAILGSPGLAAPVESHAEMTNVVPFSSPQGSPNGQVVTAEPMSGPIVALGEIGLVGKRKGSLVPLAGRTEGAKRSPELKTVVGSVGTTAVGRPIALATEDVDAIGRRDGGRGAPLLKGTIGGGIANEKIGGTGLLAQGSRKTALENLKPNPLEKANWGNKNSPFSMEGPLKYRRILKMQLPPYPRWAEEKGIEATVSLRLWVDVQGRVKENMYLEKTSGYSEMDQLAREALARFIFVPLPDDQPREDEWGVATFRFQFKK